MARWLAGFIAIAVIVAILTSVLLWVAGGMRPLPVTYGRTAIGVLGLVVAPITFAAVGWLLATRVPGNPTGWLFVIVAVAVGLMLPTNLLVGSATETLKPASPVVIWVAWIRQVFSVPVTLMSLTIAALIFPSGRALPGWWRWTVPAGVLAGSLLAVSTALDPRGLYSYPSFPNPTSLPIEWEWLVTATRIGAAVLQAGCIVLAVVSVVIRYRGGSDATRAQLRWIALGVGIAGFGSIPYLVARFIIRMPNDLGEFVSAIAQMGICAFPIAAAFAISRYRLWDVDLLIGRTLVYVPLSAACGGLYSAGIALFQRLFVVVTGETSDSAIVLAVLVVATAFTPLRRWLESLVEHRFPAAQPAARPAVVDRPVATSDPSPVKPTTDKAPRVRQVRPRRAGRVGAVTAALDAAPAVRALHLQEVGDDGAIDCPLYGRRAAQACLDCPNFTSVVREPRLTVICSRPA